MKARQAEAQNIEQYIEMFPIETQLILKQLRTTIRKAAPEAEEAISYGMPTFRFMGNMVYFAAYKNHIGFYPGSSTIRTFKQELSEYKTAKGSIQFPITRSMPLDLITEIVKFRIQENLEKAALKKNLRI